MQVEIAFIQAFDLQRLNQHALVCQSSGNDFLFVGKNQPLPEGSTLLSLDKLMKLIADRIPQLAPEFIYQKEAQLSQRIQYLIERKECQLEHPGFMQMLELICNFFKRIVSFCQDEDFVTTVERMRALQKQIRQKSTECLLFPDKETIVTSILSFKQSNGAGLSYLNLNEDIVEKIAKLLANKTKDFDSLHKAIGSVTVNISSPLTQNAVYSFLKEALLDCSAKFREQQASLASKTHSSS